MDKGSLASQNFIDFAAVECADVLIIVAAAAGVVIVAVADADAVAGVVTGKRNKAA